MMTKQESAVVQAAKEWRTMWPSTVWMAPASMKPRAAIDALLKSERPKKKTKP